MEAVQKPLHERVLQFFVYVSRPKLSDDLFNGSNDDFAISLILVSQLIDHSLDDFSPAHTIRDLDRRLNQLLTVFLVDCISPDPE